MTLCGTELFMLRVRGDSMIEAGILDGDYVVVRQQSTADNGDIVVAMIDDESTVKRFFKEPGRVRLQPENSTMAPIYAIDVSILGKVQALLSYSSVEDILSQDVVACLRDFQMQCREIHHMIYKLYVDYSIHTALAG